MKIFKNLIFCNFIHLITLFNAVVQSQTNTFTTQFSSTESSASAVAASATCVDSDKKCSLWASQGECQTNVIWMMANCRRSCQSCQGGDKAWQLRNYLTKNYDNFSINSNNTVKTVRIESVRINHIEVDEEKQMVRTFGKMVMSWNDSKLVWDSNSWGISWLNFYWIQIWTPQLIQINAPNILSSTFVSGKVLAANYTGQIYMWIDFNFVAPYNFDYSNYPNDYQQICYKFDDKRYFSVRFVVSDDVKSSRHESIKDTHVSGWKLMNLQMTHSKYVIQLLSNWKKNPFDVQTNNCEMCIGLKRNAAFYFNEMLCPTLLSSFLTLIAPLFQLSNNQLILLAFSILIQMFSIKFFNSRFPIFTNSTPIIVQYTGFNLVSTGFLFIASLALKQLALTQTNIPLPHSVEKILRVVDNWIFCCFNFSNSKNLINSEHNLSGAFLETAQILNRLIFAFFFLIYCINILFTFVFV